MNQIYTPANVPVGASPTIASFTANPTTVSAGQPVTLSWSVNGSEYNIITPQVGAVRGNTLMIVSPAGTTTYSLEATNQFGRTKKTVTVTAK
jgi:hypothetical protein